MVENSKGVCGLDKKIRILVAEEDSGFLKMMEDSLKASGSLYHTEKVSSGEECLKKLQKEKFDILLLDHALS
jgi:CheY-like chemotaxis protein